MCGSKNWRATGKTTKSENLAQQKLFKIRVFDVNTSAVWYDMFSYADDVAQLLLLRHTISPYW